jgi:hypothetical protein
MAAEIRVTEAGNRRVTESSDARVTEQHVATTAGNPTGAAGSRSGAVAAG